MRNILLLAGSMLLTVVSMAQNPKGKKIKKPPAISAEQAGCCITDMASATVDESFMSTATTKEFGMLHEEPLAFTLDNPLGAMAMFNCSDGMPGQAYSIPAKEATINFLIVIQEWWGLNDHIKQEAERYFHALDGRVNVLAVDLYDGKVASTVDSAQKLIGAALKSKRKETILQGAMDYAGKGANIYTVGWCFGGMMSLQTAIMGGDRVRGCVMYYGTPEKDKTRIDKLKCDVLGIFATQDRGIPNEVVDQFAADMKSAGKNFTLQRYDAVHAFANPSNPGYNKAFGDDAFEKAAAFIKARLR